MSNYNEFKKKLLNNAYENNIPIIGEFEILGNCNFSCSMCYAKTDDKALSTDEWLDLFKQAYDNGMLYALLTGGEVFLHKDFLVLYQALFDMGVKVTVFTNGSKLTEEILDVFKLKRPEKIAITLYGYDKLSYYDFTGIDAFDDVDENINKIISAGLPLVLRTIPMPLIYKNLDNIIEYVKTKNKSLEYFLYVSKTKPDVKRLSTKELIDFERKIKKAFEVKEVADSNHYCGAFKNGFFINHKGFMQGCSLMPIPTMKVNENFMKVFLELKKVWDQLVDDSICRSCKLNQSCFSCLARRYLEGNIFGCNEYLKAYAEKASL